MGGLARLSAPIPLHPFHHFHDNPPPPPTSTPPFMATALGGTLIFHVRASLPTPATIPRYRRRSLLDKASRGRDGRIRARLAGDCHHDDKDDDDDDDGAAILVVLHIPMHPTRASGKPSIGHCPSAVGVSKTMTMTTIPTTTERTPTMTLAAAATANLHISLAQPIHLPALLMVSFLEDVKRA